MIKHIINFCTSDLPDVIGKLIKNKRSCKHNIVVIDSFSNYGERRKIKNNYTMYHFSKGDTTNWN